MQPIFDNDHFLAVDKGAGALTVPSRMGSADPRPCLGRDLEAGLGIRLWPLHRLDVEVSGLVVFAKDAAAHRAASRWFEGRDVRKVYEALTEQRHPAPPVGVPQEWRSRLLRGKKRAYESRAGKDALTRATCLGTKGPWLAWKLEPLTGRPHQLRVHLAAHGFPIAGDALYGAALPAEQPGIALRAVELDLAGCPGRETWGLPERLQVTRLFA